jgi:hypothetical protein
LESALVEAIRFEVIQHSWKIATCRIRLPPNPHCGKTGIPAQASIYSTPIKVAGLQLLTRQRGLEAENVFLQPSGKFEVGRWA